MRGAWSEGEHAARKTPKPARSMTGGPQPWPLVFTGHEIPGRQKDAQEDRLLDGVLGR